MTARGPKLRLRIVFAPKTMIGPGKADLLHNIAETGSIAAAGRRMGMSYKRAWQLVETLNAMFANPLVTACRGGAGRGGASLTGDGEKVLALYRAAEAASTEASAEAVSGLAAMLGDIAERK